eukprot:COSAG06_NODE_319_length_17585_cov_7.462466_3_plen_88_part_00
MAIAPKSMTELESWADTKLRDDAAKAKEWDGLNDRGCFEHDLKRRRARARLWHAAEPIVACLQQTRGGGVQHMSMYTCRRRGYCDER